MVYLTTVYELDSIDMYEKGVQEHSTSAFSHVSIHKLLEWSALGVSFSKILMQEDVFQNVTGSENLGYLDLEDGTKVLRDSLK